jgi:hypothetical protein
MNAAMSNPTRLTQGSDILANISLSGDSKAGAGILKATLNPRSFPGTRIYQESLLWTRWRPLSLRVRLVSGATSLVIGRMALGWSADSRDIMPSGMAGIVKMGTLRPHMTTLLSQTCEIVIPSRRVDVSRQWYLMSGEPDDSDHGTLFAILMASLSTTTGTQTFQVELDWSVEFSGPDIQSTGSETETIYADDSYTPFFTDSVNDWASGGRLTLKHKEGGGVVPFPDARPGSIYKLDSKAKLTYKISGKSDGRISYGVRIANYYVPGLAVFDTIEGAKKYASSGDSNDCLAYSSAGDWVTPENPAWSLSSSARFASVLTRPSSSQITSREPPHCAQGESRFSESDSEPGFCDLSGEF